MLWLLLLLLLFMFNVYSFSCFSENTCSAVLSETANIVVINLAFLHLLLFFVVTIFMLMLCFGLLALRLLLENIQNKQTKHKK